VIQNQKLQDAGQARVVIVSPGQKNSLILSLNTNSHIAISSPTYSCRTVVVINEACDTASSTYFLLINWLSVVNTGTHENVGILVQSTVTFHVNVLSPVIVSVQDLCTISLVQEGSNSFITSLSIHAVNVCVKKSHSSNVNGTCVCVVAVSLAGQVSINLTIVSTSPTLLVTSTISLFVTSPLESIASIFALNGNVEGYSDQYHGFSANEVAAQEIEEAN
jgi:hypothetical protein